MIAVSVIIPSFNHENYIEDCLQSVLEQTLQDYEIIITDDGSKDDTVKKIKKFSDRRIKLFINQKNQGASIAADHCFKNSSGKYIAMLSSDDIWLPEKLEKQVNFLETYEDINAVFSRVLWIDNFGNTINKNDCPHYNIFNVENRTRFEWLNHFFYKGNALCHPSSLIRRNIIESIGYLNPLFAALPDFDLWTRLCLNSEIFILHDQLVKFRYFGDKSNASGDTYSGKLRNSYENRKILDHYLAVNNIDEFFKIFPHNNKVGKEFSIDDLRFLLGCLAVDSGVQFKVLWGLDIIFHYLNNEDNIIRAEELFGFTPIDFINLTGKKDIHNILTTKSLTQLNKSRESDDQTISKATTKKLEFYHHIIRLKTKISLRKQIKLITNSKYYDQEFYLNQNPDVRESKIDPKKHYILFGGFEGRDPSPLFNSQWYIDEYEDVKLNGINPLVHYLIFGIIEGRKIKESCLSQMQNGAM